MRIDGNLLFFPAAGLKAAVGKYYGGGNITSLNVKNSEAILLLWHRDFYLILWSFM